MNKLKNSLLAIVFVLPVLFVATSCSDDDDDSDKSGWTDANKAAQVDQCVSDEEGTQEQCQCFYDKIAETYTRDEFEDLADGEEIPDEEIATILGFIIDCDINLDLE